MISIITPAHKIIPWYNLRFVSVCSQSYKDWEWIILDNSEDGCVKRYVDGFFKNMQGRLFPECREKIKCFHEPFKDVSIEDSRIGKLKNRCIELTSCSDDDFILLLDFDDFLYDGFLMNIHLVSEQYPDCEFISGMLQESVAQWTNGHFFTHSLPEKWSKAKDIAMIEMLYDRGMNGGDYIRAAEDYLNSDYEYSVKLVKNYIAFNDCTIILGYPGMTVLNENGWSFFGSTKHPYVYKKGPFLKKIGGYNVKSSREDWVINHTIMWRLNNPVYIMRPCYMQCGIFNEKRMRESATMNTCTKELAEKNDEIMYLAMAKQHETFNYGDYIKPLFWY